MSLVCNYTDVPETLLNEAEQIIKLELYLPFKNRKIFTFRALTKKVIDKSSYKSIKPVGSRPGILYRLGKVHKKTPIGLPPFARIHSVIATPTYISAKSLLQF